MTTAPREPVPLPAVLDSLFVQCEGDGALLVRVFEEERLLGKAELEWVAKSAESWTVEVLSPIGQRLVRLESEKAGLGISGRLADRLPPLTLAEKDFLEVDGHLVGLRRGEVPCLLSYHLPRSWLPYLTEAEVRGRRARLVFEDEIRDIEIQVRGLKDRKGWGRVCTNISWSQMLGLMRSEVRWCQGLAGKKRQATLTGLGEHKLEWVRLDD